MASRLSGLDVESVASPMQYLSKSLIMTDHSEKIMQLENPTQVVPSTKTSITMMPAKTCHVAIIHRMASFDLIVFGLFAIGIRYTVHLPSRRSFLARMLCISRIFLNGAFLHP